MTTSVLLVILLGLIVIGCDEGMNMVAPVIDNPTVEPGTKDPISNGEMKQSEEPSEPEKSEEPTKPEVPAEPTLTINSAAQADDGSITVSGSSTELSAGETVTITLGDAITVTTTVNNQGAWSATVPAAKAAQLSAGTVPITATAGTAKSTESFEHTPEEPEEEPAGHGIVVSTAEEQVMLDIVLEASGYDDSTATDKERRIIKNEYNYITAQYGSLFDVNTEVGRATFRRFAEYEVKKWELATTGGGLTNAALKQYYGEAYGFSYAFAVSLVHDIYLKEKPEDEKLLSIRWQVFDIGMEYLLLQIANPDATEEELKELLRESIRAGKVTIAA